MSKEKINSQERHELTSIKSDETSGSSKYTGAEAQAIRDKHYKENGVDEFGHLPESETPSEEAK